MPQYLYECAGCQIRQTIDRPINAKEIPPHCLGCNRPMVRVYTIGAVQFKGQGFAIND